MDTTMKQALFPIYNPVLRIAAMLAALFLATTLQHCASQQSTLGERLRSSDERIQQDAFKEFDSLDPASKKKHLDVMTTMLFNRNPDIQIRAAESIGRMGPAAEDAVPDLALALNEKNDFVRLHAVKTLAEIGTAAVSLLITTLNHHDPALRRAAADALGRIGPGAQAAVPALTPLLKEQENEIAPHAASALGQIGPTAVPALVQVARQGDRFATDMAASAFVNLKSDPSVIRELAHVLGKVTEEPAVRSFSAKALGNMPEHAQAAMAELILASGDENNDVRSAARAALGQMGLKAVPALMEALKHIDPRVRAGSAAALGSMGPGADNAVLALVQALKDEDRTVRIYSIQALGKLRVTSGDVVKALALVLDVDADDLVRLNAVQMLNKIGTAEAKEAISKYNKKSNKP